MITPTARARVMCCPLMTQSLISQTGSGESTVHTFAHMASTVNMLWWVLSRTHPNTHLPESARNLGCQIGHRERAIIAPTPVFLGVLHQAQTAWHRTSSELYQHK